MLKYGDQLVDDIYISHKSGIKTYWFFHTYCYRKDPVPLVHKYRSTHVGGNRMHVMNEKRQYEKSLRHLIRGKRRPTALPDPWDYWNIANEQIHGWKRSKKAKQYM